jgi:hypothetical protein
MLDVPTLQRGRIVRGGIAAEPVNSSAARALNGGFGMDELQKPETGSDHCGSRITMRQKRLLQAAHIWRRRVRPVTKEEVNVGGVLRGRSRHGDDTRLPLKEMHRGIGP